MLIKRRIVSDRFIFGLTDEGMGLLLDLPTAINNLSSEGLGTSNLWVKKMIPKRNSFIFHPWCTIAHVDEFQIVMQDIERDVRHFTAITFNSLVQAEPRECPCVLLNKPRIYRLYHLVTQCLKWTRKNHSRT